MLIESFGRNKSVVLKQSYSVYWRHFVICSVVTCFLKLLGFHLPCFNNLLRFHFFPPCKIVLCLFFRIVNENNKFPQSFVSFCLQSEADTAILPKINVKEKCWQQSLQKLNPFLRPPLIWACENHLALWVSFLVYLCSAMFECILSNIVMPSASLSLIGFAFGLIIIQLDDWQSTSNTLVFVFTYLLIFMSPNPLQTKISHTGSRAEQFGIKQPTLCALRRTWERDPERKRPRQRKGSQCASADPLSHTEREVQFPLPPTCSALASFRMQWWLQQHCGTLQVTSSYFRFPSPVFICFAFCLIWAIMKEKHLSWCCHS